MSIRCLGVFVASVSALLLALTGQASGQTYTWDPVGNQTDFGGNLSLTASSWWNGSSDVQWPNTTSYTAQFGYGTGGTVAYSVSLQQATTANGIIFQNQAYTLSGSTLDLDGASPTITMNASAGTIGSIISGGNGLTVTGTGMLTLTGANSYIGGTSVSGGVLSFANGALGTSGNITMNGGALQWNGANTQDISSRLVMVGSTTATLDTQGNNVSFSSAIGSNSFATLVKAGSGTLTLKSNSTYSGGTTILNGAVAATDISSPGGSGLITIGPSGTFSYTTDGGNTPTINNAIAGSGIFNGTASANNQPTFSGDMSNFSGTFNATNIQFQAPNVGSSQMTLNMLGYAGVFQSDSNTSRTLNIGALKGSGTFQGGTPGQNVAITLSIGGLGTSTTFSGLIYNNYSNNAQSGTEGVTKVGSGALTLTAASPYTGATIISAGALVAGANSASGSTGAFGASTGAMLLADGNTGVADNPAILINGAYTVGRSISVGSVFNTAAYTPYLGGSNTSGTATFSGGITLNTAATSYTGLTLIQAAGGTVNFSGTWTTNGLPVSVGNAANLGTVELSSNALTNTGGVNLNCGTLLLGNTSVLANSPLTVSGGTLNLNGLVGSVGALSGSGGVITGAAGSVLTVLQASNQTYSGAITGSAGLTMNGSGVLLLAGTNSYSGTTTIGAGTLALGAVGTLGTGNTTILPGALLDVSAYSGGYTFGSGVLTAGRTGSFAPDINGSLNVQSASFSPAGATTAGTMTVAGNLSLTGGTIAYNPGDQITASGGALTLAGTDYIVPGTLLPSGSYTLFTAASVPSTPSSFLALGGGLSAGRQNVAFINSAGTAVVMTVSGSTGNLVWTGAASGVWDVQNHTSWYNVNSGTADVFYNGDNVTFDDTAGTANSNVAIGGTVQPGSLIVSNTAVNFAFSGGPIAGGTSLLKSGPGALTLASSNTYSGGTTLSGGSLNVNNAGSLGSGPLTITGGTLDNTSGSVITLAGTNAQNWNGDFTFKGTNSLNLGTGAVTLGSSRTVTVSGGTLTVGGSISGPAFSLTKAGSGALVLPVSNNYSGGTNLNAGLLSFANAALGSGNVTLGGETLQWNGSNTQDLSSRLVMVNSTTATLDIQGNNVSFGSAIGSSASAALVKAGSGTLTINANSTYSGGTTILNGTVTAANITAPLGAGTITIGPNATFAYVNNNGQPVLAAS